MLKQMLVCSLSALLLAGCSSEENVPKKVVKPMDLPLTLTLDTTKTPSDSDKNEAVYIMTGKTDNLLYLTGIEYFASGEQKNWFTETIKPGHYDGEKLTLGQVFDTTKGYRSYMFDLDGLMQEKSEESDDLKKVMMSGVEFRDTSFRPSEYEVLMFEKSTVQESMGTDSIDAIHSPEDIQLKKGERAFTISLSTTPVGSSSDDTL
ncbi:hypothetical protein [Exiguobacterium sp. s127]|uniref:hypothetical protein n=1 Tax=Exiguobacterium sp. s127 TaxID=2751210 RepID=UPI001BEBD084|nr:hypothetical protein [Exiguobacterium sp. s127]